MVWYLFRHGQTFFTKFNIPYGPFVRIAPLLPEGKKQAEKVAENLLDKNIEILYSSPYPRCRQTAQIVSQKIHLPIIYDERLKEQQMTSGRETLAEASQKLAEFINEVKVKKHQTVALCSHGWPLAIIINLLKKGQVTRGDLDKHPKPGEIVEIQI